jgi:hypothetical protein
MQAAHGSVYSSSSGVAIMLYKLIPAALVVIAAVAITSAAPQRADGTKADEPDFAGKILVVAVKEPAKGAVLQKAQIKRLGGRSFLVGDSVKRAADDDLPEETIWFPVDDLLMIREFKTLEEVRKIYAAKDK